MSSASVGLSMPGPHKQAIAAGGNKCTGGCISKAKTLVLYCDHWVPHLHGVKGDASRHNA